MSFLQSVGEFNSDSFLKGERRIFSSVFVLLLFSGAEGMPLNLTVARYAVTSQRSPLLTDTIILAETVHRALVELSDGSQVFTGCDSSHRPLQGHGHAHIFCESNPGTGRGGKGEITNITVFASMGFGLQEQEALQRLKEVYVDCECSVQLALLGMGKPEDFIGTDPERGQCPLLARARSWVSRTPLLPTCHPKATRAMCSKVDATGFQIGSPEHELLRLLLLAGFPEPEAMEPVRCTRVGGRDVPWRAFVRRREMEERRPAANGAGYGFRIELG